MIEPLVLRRWSPLRAPALRQNAVLRALWWAALRVIVGALAVGVVLGLAQLTVHVLVAAYAGVTPYA